MEYWLFRLKGCLRYWLLQEHSNPMPHQYSWPKKSITLDNDLGTKVVSVQGLVYNYLPTYFCFSNSPRPVCSKKMT